MSNYIDLLQALENDYEAQLLNEFYSQENVHWKPVSNISKLKKLKEIRKNYRLKQLFTQRKIKENINANHK